MSRKLRNKCHTLCCSLVDRTSLSLSCPSSNLRPWQLPCSLSTEFHPLLIMGNGSCHVRLPLFPTNLPAATCLLLFVPCGPVGGCPPALKARPPQLLCLLPALRWSFVLRPSACPSLAPRSSLSARERAQSHAVKMEHSPWPHFHPASCLPGTHISGRVSVVPSRSCSAHLHLPSPPTTVGHKVSTLGPLGFLLSQSPKGPVTRSAVSPGAGPQSTCLSRQVLWQSSLPADWWRSWYWSSLRGHCEW